MSDLVELYLLFLALYLFESIAWVPRRTVGFFRFAGRWRARAAFRPNASWSVGAIFGKPWPPLSPPWLAEPLPLAVDPDGVTLIEGDGHRISWNELDAIRADGERVRNGDTTLVVLATRTGAAALADVLERARRAPAKRREPALRDLLSRRFDVAEARARRQRFASRARWLRISCNALWLFLFGGLGVAAFTGHMLILLAAAAMSIVLWPVNALVFSRTLARLDWLTPTARPPASKRWVAYLSPLSGLRAADLIARELFGDLDPLALAACLLEDGDLMTLARPRLVAVLPRDATPLGWWREQHRVEIERVLRERKLDPAAILAPPLRDGPHVETYCPSCLAQYDAARKAGAPCPNDTCAGIALRGFAEVEKTS